MPIGLRSLERTDLVVRDDPTANRVGCFAHFFADTAGNGLSVRSSERNRHCNASRNNNTLHCPAPLMRHLRPFIYHVQTETSHQAFDYWSAVRNFITALLRST